MSAPANPSPVRKSDTPAGGTTQVDEKSFALKLGVGFDGRFYRYRDYRYDRLSDALNYAKLDRTRPGWQPLPGQSQWLEPLQPAPEERRLMEEFGIAFDGRCYIYDGYRYDHCKDAANYARLKGGRKKQY